MTENIPYNRPPVVGNELTYITNAMEREHRLSGGGFYTAACEAWLRQRLGASDALLTHSCTGALELAALLIGAGPGDEIIMPSFTFPSTANAFVLRGAVPVFVDISSDTLNLDAELVECAITPRTRAVVPVHYAGYPCDMDAIGEIARRYGLRIVEDAAQGILSSEKGRMLGTIGDLGCLSFHETKNIVSGEGGALLINDPALIERAEILRDKGTDRGRMLRGEIDKYTWQDVGSSYVPSELTAAFLFAQFERAEEIMARRREIHRAYRTSLTPLIALGVQLSQSHDDDCRQGGGHIFYLLTRAPEERDQLLSHLRAAGIFAIFHYVPLHTSPAGRRFGRAASETLSVTDRVSATLVRLPIFFDMSDEEIRRVIGAVLGFYRLANDTGAN